jgi:hypothetical protein
LRSYAESPSPLIFCCSPLDTDFEYFDDLQQNGFSNLAIIDIDGCYTNNIGFPEMYHEREQLKALNLAKNPEIV